MKPYLFCFGLLALSVGCSHLSRGVRGPASEDVIPDFSDVKIESPDGLDFEFGASTQFDRSPKETLRFAGRFIEDLKERASGEGFSPAVEVSDGDWGSPRFKTVGKKKSNVGNEVLALFYLDSGETATRNIFQIRGVVSEDTASGFRMVDSRGIAWQIGHGDDLAVFFKESNKAIPQVKMSWLDYLRKGWLETSEIERPFARKALFKEQARINGLKSDVNLVLLTPEELAALPKGTVVQSPFGHKMRVGVDRPKIDYEEPGYKKEAPEYTWWGLRAPKVRSDLALAEEAPKDMFFDPRGRKTLPDGSSLWRVTAKQLENLPDGTVLYSAGNLEKRFVLGQDYVGSSSSEVSVDRLGFSTLGFKAAAGASAPGAGEKKLVSMKQNSKTKNEVLERFLQTHPEKWSAEDWDRYSKAKQVDLEMVLAMITGISFGPNSADARHLIAENLPSATKEAIEAWILEQYPELKNVERPKDEATSRRIVEQLHERYGKKIYLVRPSRGR